MSLLTDKELKVIYRQTTARFPQVMTIIGLVESMVLKAVVEWLDGYCDHLLNMEGHPVDSPPTRRHACLFCRENLFVACRKGKMPGEEK